MCKFLNYSSQLRYFLAEIRISKIKMTVKIGMYGKASKKHHGIEYFVTNGVKT